LPLAAREARAKALGRSLRAALPPGSALPDLAALRRALPGEAFSPIASLLGMHAPPRFSSMTAGCRPGERLVVSLPALRQFLEDPLQGSARFRLRLREIESEEEIAEREDESFETERPLRAALVQEGSPDAPSLPLWDRVLAGFTLLCRREELRGRAPTGFFADAERPALAAILRGWLEELVIWAGGKPLTGVIHRFGRAQARDTLASVRHDPIRLDLPDPLAPAAGAPLSVEIVGSTGLHLSAGAEPASVVLTSRSRSGDDRTRRQRDRLRAFVDHLALSAAGLSGGAHGTLVVRSQGGDHELHPARFRMTSVETARSYLADLISDLLTGARDAGGVSTGVHPYLLPCEAVFAARERGRGLGEEIERLRDNYLEQPWRLGFSSVYGPVPEAVERHDPPSEAEARRMAGTRFGLYFDLLQVAWDAGELCSPESIVGGLGPSEGPISEQSEPKAEP
jgi:hypothetical protein